MSRQSHRYEIRKVRERGYHTVVDEWSHLPAFVKFYRSLMDNVQAAPTYRYSDSYFENLGPMIEDSVHLMVVLSEDGKPVAYPFSYDEFVEATIPLLEGKSFYEIEIGRKVDVFGQVAHVYSAYEARETPDHPEIQFRGVNMIHLWNDDMGEDGKPAGRWWIMGIIWDNEREGLALPKAWLSR